MSELMNRIRAARGFSTTPDPLIEENRIREAITREADYSIIGRQVRPLVAGCISVERARQLVKQYVHD
jgi:hypothetical protein